MSKTYAFFFDITACTFVNNYSAACKVAFSFILINMLEAGKTEKGVFTVAARCNSLNFANGYMVCHTVWHTI